MIIPVPFDLFYFWLINHLITAYQVLLLEDSIYYHFFPLVGLNCLFIPNSISKSKRYNETERNVSVHLFLSFLFNVFLTENVHYILILFLFSRNKSNAQIPYGRKEPERKP